MFDILLTLFFFVEAVFIHLALCRKRSADGLLLLPFFGIAFSNLIVLWVFFWAARGYFKFDVNSVWGVPLCVTATLIYILLIPTYLVFYFSTQQMSPSKKILLLLARGGPMSFQELLVHFSDDEFVMPRLKELIGVRWLIEHGGWYVLTPMGTQMAKMYTLYQAIFGRTKGG